MDASQQQRASTKVLLIEDDALLSEFIQKKFRSVGYALTAVDTGEAGIEKAIEEHPALILLDLILPGINGFDVFQKLREHKETADIPYIIISNLSHHDAQKQLPEISTFPYVVKAESTPQEILEKAEEVLRGREHVH